MTQRQSFQVLLVAAVVALSIIGSASTLVALGKLDPAAYATLVGVALSATGFGSIQIGAKSLNGGTTIDLERLAKVSPEIAQTVANSIPNANVPAPMAPPIDHSDAPPESASPAP